MLVLKQNFYPYFKKKFKLKKIYPSVIETCNERLISKNTEFEVHKVIEINSRKRFQVWNSWNEFSLCYYNSELLENKKASIILTFVRRLDH